MTRSAFEQVRAHAVEGYPHEVCGVLAGRPGLVTEAHRVRNTVEQRTQDRYEMDPNDQVRIQRACDARGLKVVGYYHSHPDQPAHASRADSRRSWTGHFYLIASCVKGDVVDCHAFTAVKDGGPMRPELLELV